MRGWVLVEMRGLGSGLCKCIEVCRHFIMTRLDRVELMLNITTDILESNIIIHKGKYYPATAANFYLVVLWRW